MITLKTGSAVHAKELHDQWEPHCHWLVQPGELIEAEFVQGLLDKFGPELKAYAISPFGSAYCIELQFRDSALGEQCNREYVRGWRKGGEVATKKKAANGKPRKRLPCNRMYILPDGTEFLYYALWDGHGNLMGKVLTETGLSANDDGHVRLDNKIVHRSVVEQGTLVAKGHERFWIGERPLPPTTAKQRKAVLETVCRLLAASPTEGRGGYGAGDCFYGLEIEIVYKALPFLSQPTIDSAIVRLASEDLLCRYTDPSFVGVTELGWRSWSKWDDHYFLEILFSESGQDWPRWEDRDFWKDIDSTVWKQLEEQYQREELSENNNGDDVHGSTVL